MSGRYFGGCLKTGILFPVLGILLAIAGLGCDGGSAGTGGGGASIREGAYASDSTVDDEGYADILYLEFNQDGTGTYTIKTFLNNKFFGFGRMRLDDGSGILADKIATTWIIVGDQLTLSVPAAKLVVKQKILSLSNSGMELVAVKVTRNGVDIPVSGKSEKFHRIDWGAVAEVIFARAYIRAKTIPALMTGV